MTKDKTWMIVGLPGLGVVNALVWRDPDNYGNMYAHYITVSRLTADGKLNMVPHPAWFAGAGPFRIDGEEVHVTGDVSERLVNTFREMFNLDEKDEPKPKQVVQIPTPGETGKIVGQNRFNGKV